MMSDRLLSFRAMEFAKVAHAEQRRKYTGDLRTTDRELLSDMVQAYRSGLSVRYISNLFGIPEHAIKNYVANNAIERDEGLFEFGVQLMATDGEVFKRVSHAPSYFISNHGRLIGMTIAKPGSLIKPHIGPNGYLSAKILEGDGVARGNYIHRMVASEFHGGALDDMQVAHWDGNKQNNRLENLRWATPSENAADKERHGTVLRGERHPNYKHGKSIKAPKP